ncbi:MAG: D-galactarate dehydratase [Paracoccaceae bacterium]
MKHAFAPLAVAFGLSLALGGCAEVKSTLKSLRPGASARAPAPGANTADALDTTTEAERAAALDAGPTSGERELGTTVASLGSPTEPGFWMKTPLVSAPARGRVVTVTGESVAVDLIPSGGPAGGGSQLSLAAFRALGLSLTGLPQVTVFSG